jgi:hypothetical protein
MMMDALTSTEWEEFDPRAVPTANPPTVTIRAAGTFGLSAAALRALGNPKGVILLFNQSAGRIGLRATGGRDAHAVPVRKHTASESYWVSGTRFLKHDGIAFAVSHRFPARSAHPGMIVIDLSEGVPAGSNRKHRRSPQQ